MWNHRYVDVCVCVPTIAQLHLVVHRYTYTLYVSLHKYVRMLTLVQVMEAAEIGMCVAGLATCDTKLRGYSRLR